MVEHPNQTPWNTVHEQMEHTVLTNLNLSGQSVGILKVSLHVLNLSEGSVTTHLRALKMQGKCQLTQHFIVASYLQGVPSACGLGWVDLDFDCSTVNLYA